MLTRNISQARGLVNGARGVVERFEGRSTPLPVVRFASVSLSAALEQLREQVLNLSSALLCFPADCSTYFTVPLENDGAWQWAGPVRTWV